MIRTLEATIDKTGQIRLAEPLQLTRARRALVTVLDEPPGDALETLLMSEESLQDWSRAEEDEAWDHLQ